jgi:hypothetical protein
MITGGYNIDTGVEYFTRRIDCDASAPGGIFSVGDNDIDIVVLAQFRQQPAQGVPPGFADNIADKKKIHETELNSRRSRGKSAFGRADVAAADEQQG